MTTKSSEVNAQPGNLSGIRVVELADEQAEYCGRLFAGLGADVIKVEPPAGNSTRTIGPFHEDKPDPEASLYFWNYNLAKRSIVIDLESADGATQFIELLATADVLLESTPKTYLERLGLGRERLRELFPSLVVARMSPFGDVGPWADYKGSDLIHLALGGVMMNCGYDPEPDGQYDLPPIAPQAWHSYHVAGEQLAAMTVAALLYRRATGQGQLLSCAVHQAVACNTELDVMNWVFQRAPFFRQTCRHALKEVSNVPSIGMTKDGRWIMGYAPITRHGSQTGFADLVHFLDGYQMAGDLTDERYSRYEFLGGGGGGQSVEHSAHVLEVMQRVFKKFTFEKVPWHEAQKAGFMWVPLRKPHENALDDHWLQRGTFGEVEHPEHGRSFTYSLSKWVSTEAPWRTGPRAPLLGEHTEEIKSEINSSPKVDSSPPNKLESSSDEAPHVASSRRAKPFALDGIRILDFSWVLASGGAPRFLTALGAQSIKIEWKAKPDIRYAAQLPIGGREARQAATGPLKADLSSMNISGQFNDWRAGQRSLALNVKDPEGLKIAQKLLAMSDIVVEGFSPGVLASWGLSYEQMQKIKPDIIYAQQSGMGASGSYGRYRAVGPIAASLAGASEMSGAPEPAPPAGWGYSYLDWFGAYNLALAMMSALHYRENTGKGQWIDASQCESGIFLTGPAVLDWSANNRPWQRYGNRSPYKLAAPHGAFRCRGDDRWLAIACFTEEEWQALVEVSGHESWGTDERFSTLAERIRHQDELEAEIMEWSATQDAFAAMESLQRAGVPAGVCQTAEDRCDSDPQLAALEWFTEVTGTEIGTWPVKEIPVSMSETPPFMGGPIDRGAPCYGEDTEYVLREILNIPGAEVERLSETGVIDIYEGPGSIQPASAPKSAP